MPARSEKRQARSENGMPPEARSAVLPPEHAGLAGDLLAWFARARRPLPWRATYEPYAVWVSEVMLQQTRMERAVVFFERWMRLFPDLRSLARAHPDAVLKAWEGLGYYSRARNLHKAAQILVREREGRFPEDFAALRALPGVGEYTAGALLSIAFNRPFAAVDANVERVFARLFDIDAPVKSAAAADFIRRMARLLIPEGRARDFNQALMELGALICSRKPRCAGCPLAARCQARRLDITGERPVPGRRAAPSALEIVTGVLFWQGRLFVQKRLDSGVWAGFWEFPGGRLEAGERPEQGIAREFREETEFRVVPVEYLGLVRHAYTRYRIAMHCFVCAFEGPPQALDGHGRPLPRLHAATACRWLTPGDLEELVFPAGHRKLLDAWLPRLMRAGREL